MSNSVPALPPRSSLAVLLLTVLIGSTAAFAIFAIGQNYWIDDSFISFRYARNLVAGHGLVFNAGDAVEGYTNFLWTMVTSLGLSLGFEAMPFAQAAGLLAQAITLWCLYEIGRGAGHSGLRPLIAPLFLSTSFGFTAYPMTGMETSLFTMLLTLCFLALQRRSHERLLGGVLLGIGLFALGTTRFDGFGPVILLLSYPLLFGGRERNLKSLLIPVGIFLTAMLLYNLWRFSFYPTRLPNTFHAKTTFSTDRVLIGLAYLRGFASGAGAVAVVLALIPFVTLRATTAARYMGWVVIGQFGYVALIGGDWMTHHRFVLPVLPLLCALLAEGLFLIGDALKPQLPAPRFSAVFAVAALLAIQIMPFKKDLKFADISGVFFKPKDAEAIGKYLAETYPPDQLVAIEWGGIIPYYLENNCLDTWGLTDHGFAVNPKLADSKFVYGTDIGPWHLSRRKPDLIACNARLLPTEEAARKSVQPGGPNHYRYYPQMASEQYGYRWQVFQVGPDSWWPALVKR